MTSGNKYRLSEFTERLLTISAEAAIKNGLNSTIFKADKFNAEVRYNQLKDRWEYVNPKLNKGQSPEMDC
jgi:hypothetical protein